MRPYGGPRTCPLAAICGLQYWTWCLQLEASGCRQHNSIAGLQTITVAILSELDCLSLTWSPWLLYRPRQVFSYKLFMGSSSLQATKWASKSLRVVWKYQFLKALWMLMALWVEPFKSLALLFVQLRALECILLMIAMRRLHRRNAVCGRESGIRYADLNYF